ncbi:hypothetical protein [Breznakia pachnodae]|uniref:Uncharacterized protein n=1 Tax=Breznakia pachnodae TaxID=265178 RepID=A0ABU0E4X1_9FIRM|nr:hypothetical protein [Breznakia pachnodae]MDQ0361550.1 hypothetical protein [Breznakia pachnodae]
MGSAKLKSLEYEKKVSKILGLAKGNIYFLGVNKESIEMILTGYKNISFFNYLPPEMIEQYIEKEKIKLCLLDEDNNKVLAECTIRRIYKLMYSSNDLIDENEMINVAKDRELILRDLYLGWCLMKDIQPNLSEGHMKSKKFKKYLEEISWDVKSNYAIAFDTLISYK